MSLIRELDKRLRVLDQLQKDVREATAKVRIVPTDRDALAVLALRLQWLYGCIEGFATRVSSHVNGEVPGGPGGHITLLARRGEAPLGRGTRRAGTPACPRRSTGIP